MSIRGAPTGTRQSSEDAIVRRELNELRRIVQGIPIKVPAGGSASNGRALVIPDIPKTAHGFVVGDIIYGKPAGWFKAQANAVATAGHAGMVSRVPTVDTFDLTLVGEVTGLSGLSTGVLYYLSDATPGAYVVVASLAADAARVPVFLATSATACYLFATSLISEDLDRLVLGDATTPGSLRINFASGEFARVQTDGTVQVYYSNGNQVTIRKSDFTGTGKLIKVTELDYCEAGVAKKIQVLGTAPY